MMSMCGEFNRLSGVSGECVWRGAVGGEELGKSG